LFQAGDLVPLPHAIDPALAVQFPPPPGTAARLPRRHDDLVVVDALDLTPAGVPASTVDPVVEVLPPLALVLHLHDGMCLCRVFHPLHRVPRVYTFTHHVHLPVASLPCPPLYTPSLPAGALRYCTSFRLARLCRTRVSGLASSVALPKPAVTAASPTTTNKQLPPTPKPAVKNTAPLPAVNNEQPRHVVSTSPIVPPSVSTQHATLGVAAACPRSLQDARVLTRAKDLDESVVEPLLFAPPAPSAALPQRRSMRNGKDPVKRKVPHYRMKQRKGAISHKEENKALRPYS